MAEKPIPADVAKEMAERGESPGRVADQEADAVVERGTRARPSPYRDGQNAIRNSATGALIYLSPEAENVPGTMASLVRWANEAR